MFIKESSTKKGRKKLKVLRSYRKPSDGKPTTAVVKDLGFIEDIEREHGDPMAWAELERIRLEQEARSEDGECTIKVSRHERLEKISDLPAGARNRKNLGYAAFSSIYHELEIDEFWDNRRRHRRFGFNANSVFKTLVYSRLLYPSSKRTAWENRGMFFEDADYSLADMYRALDYFQGYDRDLLARMDRMVGKRYGRDTFLLSYDVTNYYFEIDENDSDLLDEDGNVIEKGLRKKGYSKEHRTSPIIQMGLFMDRNGLPVSYDIFPGNTHDSQTLIPMIEKAERHFSRTNLIVVADKGMMSGDNIRMIHAKRQGYIISSSIRKGDARFREYAVEDSGFTDMYDAKTKDLEFRIKSRIVPRRISVSSIDPETGEKTGGKESLVVNERQIIIWSRKYAERERQQRNKVLEKARRLIGSKSDEATAIKFGARKYIVKEPVLDGKPAEVGEYIVSLDEDKVAEEEAYDGYYCICTNVVGCTGDSDIDRRANRFFEDHPEKEVYFDNRDGFLVLRSDASDRWIAEAYHGLWKIEETFKVTKSGIEARPVYAWTAKRIRAHFLICFTALLLIRLLQYRLGWKHSDEAILDTLRAASGSLAGQNIYVFDHNDEVLADIGKSLGLDFSHKYLTPIDIRKMLGSTKK